MKIKTDVYFIATVAVSFLMLFMALVFFSLKRRNKRPNVFFGLFLVNTVLSMMSFGMLINSGLYLYVPHFLGISTLSLTTIGPLFYFYVHCLIDERYRFSVKSMVHLIPLITGFLLWLPFFLKNAQDKISYIQNWLNGIKSPELTLHYILMGSIGIQLYVYFIIIYLTLRKYEKPMKQMFSSIERINLGWLRYFLVSFSITILVLLVLFAVMLSILPAAKIYRLIPLFLSVSISVLSFRVLMQPEILIGRSIQEFTQKEKAATLYKYPDYEVEKYKQKLRKAMEQDKLYRNPYLSLNDLSAELDIGRNYLSYIINDHFKMNFFDLINTYRIKEIKEKLKNNTETKLNLIHLAMDAGFNSKTTFNVMFKKLTRMTPTQYRKKMQAAPEGV
ncbi:MAG: AraC family transcriptional regulator [Spirochaetales bacterium]|nr:AraC family transcriptional regulator [Spirochaetales bacterium]